MLQSAEFAAVAILRIRGGVEEGDKELDGKKVWGSRSQKAGESVEEKAIEAEEKIED